MRNLLEVIQQEMANDEENWDEQSEKLIDLYSSATPSQKRILNDALMCICGWTIGSLLEKRSP